MCEELPGKFPGRTYGQYGEEIVKSEWNGMLGMLGKMRMRQTKNRHRVTKSQNVLILKDGLE